MFTYFVNHIRILKNIDGKQEKEAEIKPKNTLKEEDSCIRTTTSHFTTSRKPTNYHEDSYWLTCTLNRAEKDSCFLYQQLGSQYHVWWMEL